MSSYNNPYVKQYQQSQIQTASPEKIIIMLYDGAIQFLNVAKKEMANKNIQEIHNNIIKAQRIVSELMNSLDVSIGGQVAQNLMQLYEYLHYRLIQANIKKDEAMIDEVIVHLKDLRQTWEEAIKIAGKEKAASVDILDDEYEDSANIA